MNPAFDSESFSDKGGRAANEDAQGSAEVGGIWCWVVADGLGGHEGGQLASHTALNTVLDSFRRRPEVTPDAIRRAIAHAHAAIQALQGERHGQHQMGTTLVILISDGARAVWGHVGDSRLFHIRGGRVVDQTRDHSMTQVPAGALAAGDGGEAERERSGLLQAVGLTGEIIPSVLANPVQLAPGDAFLLCVDGFWDKIFEVEMEADLAKSDSARSWLRNMCQRIQARLKEGDDNYTAIAVRAVAVRVPVASGAARSAAALPASHRPSLRQAAILTGVVAAAILAFVAVRLWLHRGSDLPKTEPKSEAAAAAGTPWSYPVTLIQDVPAKSDPQHSSLHPYYLNFGRFEVSQRDWDTVWAGRQDPSNFAGCADCPVEKVTWLDAIAFANKASEVKGLRACYNSAIIPPSPVADCTGYRLPTAAEWEFVARSRVSEKDLKNPAWLKANAVVAAKKTLPRDRNEAEPGKIYDLVGNVSEWVWDEETPSAAAKSKDRGSSPQIGRRAVRGCGFETEKTETCAPDYRRAELPDTQSPYIGFRLVCAAGPKSCGGEAPPPPPPTN